jgi:hypothetical protein
MAEAPPPFLSVARRASVESISARGPRLTVALTGGGRGSFDTIVGLTGYRPDLSFLSELALEIAPSSEGSARRARAIGAAADCLSAPAVAAGDLQSGEPGFHLIGAKSYGRLPTFLLQAGIGQAQAIVAALGAA